MPLTHRRFTVDEFLRMGEAGILTEDDRVELLDGEIVEMTPIGDAHVGCVVRLTDIFMRRARDRVVASVQNPLYLGRHQAPQPDVVLLRRPPDLSGALHPRAEETLLVIEVADTSAETDRDGKVPGYARAGIPEAWLVNLPDDVIEVYREPQGGAYTVRRPVRRGETLAPLELPDVDLMADQILG